jgi:hypothetical protein
MIADCDERLADSVDLLSWHGRTAAFEEELLATHHQRLAARFDAEVTRGGGVARMIAGLFDELPEPSRARFLLAPETAFRLLYAGGDLRFLMGALCAEARLLDEGAAAPANVWTALGDWYFPRGRATGGPVDDCFAFAPDRPFRAPTVETGAPVDLLSPYVGRKLVDGPLATLAPFEADEGRRAVARVQEAMRKIAQVNGATGRILDRFVRTVVVGRHPDGGKVMGSYSVRTFVGRTTLSLGDHYDVAGLADSLVHEAIHAFLYIIAYDLPFVHGAASERELDDEEQRRKLRSPWSGRQLDPYSFAHAVFVWFGLWQFWTIALETEVFPRERAAKLRAAAQRGFAGTALRHEIDGSADVLTPAIRAALGALKHEIDRGTFGALD